MQVDKLIKLKLRERHSPFYVKKLIQTPFIYLIIVIINVPQRAREAAGRVPQLCLILHCRLISSLLVQNLNNHCYTFQTMYPL